MRAATLQLTMPNCDGPPTSGAPIDTATSDPSNQTLVSHQSLAGPSTTRCLSVVSRLLSETNSTLVSASPAVKSPPVPSTPTRLLVNFDAVT
ncbi:hypothetical protein R4172_12410 [Rhodococcus kroppenstedtii]|uniref:hypothetical protein n=1 Tax=Rhodococcoides kroppenstedtii TaxID=293050 RepID=UPI002955B80A|nr:hypothetical protein [Rhodococcus kroppenstedtii]MDV7198365.1 hypothetical protein [Rhodococcus kroppenstedtii]